MDNIILSGMLTDFSEKYELSSESPDRQFEKFSNFCLLKTDHYDSFDFDKVSLAIVSDGPELICGHVR